MCNVTNEETCLDEHMYDVRVAYRRVIDGKTHFSDYSGASSLEGPSEGVYVCMCVCDCACKQCIGEREREGGGRERVGRERERESQVQIHILSFLHTILAGVQSMNAISTSTNCNEITVNFTISENITCIVQRERLIIAHICYANTTCESADNEFVPINCQNQLVGESEVKF